VGVELNWAAHHYSPDLYVVFAGFVSLSVILLLQPMLGWIITDVPLFRRPLQFFDKHIYSISLIHSLAILVAEEFIALNDPVGQPLKYATLKLAVVLAISCGLAYFFTPLSKAATRQVLTWTQGERSWLPGMARGGLGQRRQLR